MTENAHDAEKDPVLGAFLRKHVAGEKDPSPFPFVSENDPDAVDSFETTRFERLDASPISLGEFLEEKHREDIANFYDLQVAIDINLSAFFFTAREPASVHEKFFAAHKIDDPSERELVEAWFERASTGKEIRSLSDLREFGVSDDRAEILMTQFMARYGVRIGKLQSIRSSILAYIQDVELRDFYGC